MLARRDKVVEEGEDEVEDEASPDRDVVEHCPVGGVKGDLRSDNNDQNSGNDRAEEFVVRQN